MEDILLLVVGWGLGILGGPVAESIRRARRRKEVWQAVEAELVECRMLMAVVAYQLKGHVGEMDHEFLEWLLDIDREKSGTGRAAFERWRRLSPEQLFQMHPNKVASGTSLTLKTYSLPLIEAGLLPELVLLTVGVRREVLAIREQLGFINQDVLRLNSLHERTFDSSLIPENRALVVKDIERGYRSLGERARAIANRVDKLIGRSRESTERGLPKLEAQ